MIYIETDKGGVLTVTRSPWGVEVAMTSEKGNYVEMTAPPADFNYFDRYQLEAFLGGKQNGTRLVGANGELLKLYRAGKEAVSLHMTTHEGEAQLTLPEQHTTTILNEIRGLTEPLH